MYLKFGDFYVGEALEITNIDQHYIPTKPSATLYFIGEEKRLDFKVALYLIVWLCAVQYGLQTT